MRRERRRRRSGARALLVALALGSAACSLLTNLDNFTGGAPEDAATSDGTFADSLADALPSPAVDVLEAGVVGITVTPAAVHIAPGGSVTVNIHVGPPPGTHGDTLVSFGGIPSDVSASSGFLVIPEGSVDAPLTLSATASAMTRDSTIRVTALVPSSGAAGLATLAIHVAPPAGALDPTFGTGGLVKVAFDQSGPAICTDVVATSHGYLVLGHTVVGDASVDSLGAFTGPNFLASYKADGTLNEVFGGGATPGVVRVMTTGRAAALALDSSGNIFGTGTSAADGGATHPLLFEALPNGSLLLTNNTTVHELPVNGGGAAVVPSGPEAAIVVGYEHRSNIDEDGNYCAAFSVQPDGTLDPSFGDGGVGRTSLACDRRVSAVLDDERRLTVGVATPDPSGAPYFTAFRLLPTGLPDPSFGHGGRGAGYFKAFEGPEIVGVMEAAQRGDGGRFFVPGSAGTTNLSTTGSLAVGAWLDDGGLDPAFGEAGVASSTPLPSNGAEGLAVAVNGDSLVLGGVLVAIGTGITPLVARVTSAGPDSTFGTAGNVFLPIPSAFVSRIRTDPAGRILALVTGTTTGCTLVRLVP